MGRRALCAICLLVGTTPAAADVAVGADVPFTATELSAALAPRGIALAEGTVTLVAPSTVELATPAGRHRVELGDARGQAAARLVALHLVESGDAIDLPGPTAIVATAAPRVATAWHLAVAMGAGRGTQAADLTLGALRAEATWARGAWRWGGALGWLHGFARAKDPMQPVTADLGIARAFGGVGVGRFEIVAGPAVIAYRVRGAASGVAWGAGGSVRAVLAGTARWTLVASCDADAIAHRVVVRYDGAELAATPRVALTAGLGVRWEGP
jgi:hypothetical protein